MAAVRVRVDDFADQGLPRVCAVTGGAADHWASGRAERSASGLWFFLIGWWVFFLPKTHVDGWIPMSDTSLQRLKRNRRRALAVFGMSLVGAFGAWVLGAPFVALAFAVVAIPSVFLAVNTPGSIGATLQADARWVVLEPVHPRFAQACEERRRSASSAG